MTISKEKMADWFVGEIRCIDGVFIERLAYGFRYLASGKVVSKLEG